MRDGAELAADVYLPEGAETDPVPAIVTLTPYGKDSETLVSDDGDSLFGCGGATNAGNYCNSHVETLIKQMLTANGSGTGAGSFAQDGGGAGGVHATALPDLIREAVRQVA